MCTSYGQVRRGRAGAKGAGPEVTDKHAMVANTHAMVSADFESQLGDDIDWADTSCSCLRWGMLLWGGWG